MLTKDDVNRLTARIEAPETTRSVSGLPPGPLLLGSGVLWTPSESSEYIYVFTARHVIVDDLNKIRPIFTIRFLDEEGKEITLEANARDVAMHSDENVDAAVLRCHATVGTLCAYDVEKPSNSMAETPVNTYGFPASLDNRQSFLLSRQSITGNFTVYDSNIKIIWYKLDSEAGVNDADRDVELCGYSGGGVYLVNRNMYRLIGIHVKAAGSNAAARVLECVSIECIVEICIQREWDVPQYLSEVDGYLNDVLEACSDEFKEHPDLLRDMITVASTNHANIIQSDFCGYALECDHTDAFHKCKNFRANLLLLITILKAVSAKAELTEPIEYDTSGGKSLPLYYICSEGMSVKRRISKGNFVKSMKLDYSGRRRIKDNSLVVWNSKDQTDLDRICTKEEFDNIIQDISLSQDISGNTFDIKRGQASPKGITIIHIDELTKQLSGKEVCEFKTWIDKQID